MKFTDILIGRIEEKNECIGKETNIQLIILKIEYRKFIKEITKKTIKENIYTTKIACELHRRRNPEAGIEQVVP